MGASMDRPRVGFAAALFVERRASRSRGLRVAGSGPVVDGGLTGRFCGKLGRAKGLSRPRSGLVGWLGWLGFPALVTRPPVRPGKKNDAACGGRRVPASAGQPQRQCAPGERAAARQARIRWSPAGGLGRQASPPAEGPDRPVLFTQYFGHSIRPRISTSNAK